ncbi:leucyl/phenylalanyl-tRNA--protein transferase [Candidatus Magnetoovum chiemensis]|nr:leucyl/phenylalanyl-tRNA--protein transferase [Candidatus Magnetoovum chiemensis]
MAVFRLTEDIIFPSPHFANRDGLLAVGGDLSPKRLLAAYAMGIFPWYDKHSPILWWSPDPRLVIFPKDFKMSRSLKQTIKKDSFTVTMDQNFEQVIIACANTKRNDSDGTWITKEMTEAYISLHKLGCAHSIETWQDGKLVGGLYGIALGGAFFGESMFTLVSNASKVALAALIRQLIQWNFLIIDCQVRTNHLISLGAVEIKRSKFMQILNEALKMPSLKGIWKK